MYMESALHPSSFLPRLTWQSAEKKSRYTKGRTTSQYGFNGVKPKCVQGRWFDISFSKKETTKTLEITELSFTDTFSDPLPKRVHVIELPEKFSSKERIIGKPIVIGCHDNLLILQYIVDKYRYIKFCLIDTDTGSYQSFEDSVRYFHKDFAAVSPLECLISPALNVVLFRLPQSIMSCRKWSKMLRADMGYRDTENTRTFYIEDIKDGQLRDRKNQAVAFDLRCRNRCVFVLTDEFCLRCSLIAYDIRKKKTVMQRDHRLIRRASLANDDSDEDEGAFVQYTLEQCNISYCKSGEILVLCCTTTDHNSHDNIQVFMFASDTLGYLGSCTADLPDMSTIFVLEHQLFAPVFSPCDTIVSVRCFERGCPPFGTLLDVHVPKRPNLQDHCRACILRIVLDDEINDLPLPKKLLEYLHFSMECLLDE